MKTINTENYWLVMGYRMPSFIGSILSAYAVDTEDTDTVDGDLFAPSTWSIVAVCGAVCGTLAVCFEALCQISGF